MTLGMALQLASEARQRHRLYGDGQRFMDRRDRTGRRIHDDSQITQMASAITPCSLNLTRQAAQHHILHAPFVANSERGA